MEPQHPPDCGWHRDWHSCNCGLFDTVFWNEELDGGEIKLRYASVEEAISKQASNSSRKYRDQWEALLFFINERKAWIG